MILQIIYFLLVTAIAISTAAGSFLFPILTIFLIFVYVSLIHRKQSKKVYSINDQIVLTTGIIDNKIIKELVFLLNDNGINVEVQSINKTPNQCAIVLKLSDFDLDYITIIDDFLDEKKIEKIETQFFSSPE